MKEALIKNFGRQENFQEVILAAVSAFLNPSDLSTSLHAMYDMLHHAEFGDSAKLGLLRQAGMKFPHSVKFAMWYGDENYDELNLTIESYSSSRWASMTASQHAPISSVTVRSQSSLHKE